MKNVWEVSKLIDPPTKEGESKACDVQQVPPQNKLTKNGNEKGGKKKKTY